MIFNEMNTVESYDAVQESPYELGIGGALMHVYENECNYNAIMKAAALSELKYYNETGGDLFVQEAGALSGLVTRIKEFFKKVIEKIKSIAKKFFAKINQFTMKDKDFVKKYSKELIRRDLKDFEYDGYKFPGIKGEHPFNVTANKESVTAIKYDTDSDRVNDEIEANRGKLLGGKGKLTESEFRDELKEMLYGDKESYAVTIRNELNIISSTAELTKKAQKAEKDAIKAINDSIKTIEKIADNDIKIATKTDTDSYAAETRTKNTQRIDKLVQVYRAFANDLTVSFGAYTKALADRNRQAKAICVKALSYKHEAATLESSYEYGDIFSGVEIV